MNPLPRIVVIAGWVLWLMAGALSADLAAATPLHLQIDALVEQHLAEHHVVPEDVSSDAEFVRRVYLDLTGMIPTASQVRSFLEDPSPGRRRQLIDQLIASPDCAVHLARVFDVLLIERRIPTIKSYDVRSATWRASLTQAFAENRPWNRIVTDILASDGTDVDNAAGVKFALVRNVEPHLLTRDIGRLFLGIDLQCARCHDDPRIEDYRQADYYGIYAFLQRMTAFRDKENNVSLVGEKADGQAEFVSVFTAESGQTSPRLPGGEMIADPPLAEGREYVVQPAAGQRGVPAYSRRLKLAELLPRAETQGFSRNIVNRIWAMMLGHGIVEPLDLHHPGNPPSHPELLAALEEDFVARGFNIRVLLREIALSRTYQRSSVRANGNEPTSRVEFAVARLRSLTPEQLAWSLLQISGRVTGPGNHSAPAQNASDRPASQESPAWQLRLKELEPLDRQAQQLVDAFAGLPGQPAGTFQPTVDQALHLLNSPAMVRLTQQASAAVLTRRPVEGDVAPLAEELYLTVLSRRPARSEVAEVGRLLQSASSAAQRREALTALVWGLLLSSEFRLNH